MMPFTGLTFEGFLAGSTRMMQAGLEGAKGVATYSKPALEQSADLTAKVGIYHRYEAMIPFSNTHIQQALAWSNQNPTLAVCAGLGTTGAVILAAPGLATAPALSIIGVLGNIKAGMYIADRGMIALYFVL